MMGRLPENFPGQSDYLLPWHAWMINIFGFPCNALQCVPSNFAQISSSMLTFFPSTPKAYPEYTQLHVRLRTKKTALCLLTHVKLKRW